MAANSPDADRPSEAMAKSGATDPAPRAAKRTKRTKPAKQKRVRDSFAMPRQDFALIAMLKGRMLRFGRPTRKSELLRAGLHALTALPDEALAAAVAELAPVKARRPKKSE
jgi:hypothetical protein